MSHLATPETRYARADDGVFLGCQQFGDGPVTVVVVPGEASHLEHLWDFPLQTQWLRRLARFARVVTFDLRGCGLSDRFLGESTDFAARVASDIEAVMDAFGVERAAVYARFHSGPPAVRLAVDHPERVSHLLLDGTYARWRRDTDYPVGMPADACRQMIEVVATNWGNGRTVEYFASALAGDERHRDAFAHYERTATSPGQVRQLMQLWLAQDVRALLPRVTASTLVLHRARDQLVRVGHGRYLAEHVPGACYVEAPEGDHVTVGPGLDALMASVSEFLVGSPERVRVDRALAVVMFVDLVASTELVSRVGDDSWRAILDDFRRIVRREITRFGGREVNTRGDDFLVVHDVPTAAIAAGREIRDAVRELGIDVRAGLHLGEIELQGDDVAGVSVHVAARIQGLATAGQILVSGTVADAVVGSVPGLRDLGEHDLKGLPKAWRVYEVE